MIGLGHSTKKHTDYWRDRKIDWNKEYLQTHSDPHRMAILHALGGFRWFSLIEFGCGPGANLVAVVRFFKDKQIGGLDINKDAIELAAKTFSGGFFKVGDLLDTPFSDKSTDVILTDMSLIYVDPLHINQAIKEIKRVGRDAVVLCELHHTSFWKRWKLRLTGKYHAYNYRKLLQKHGFYDINIRKIPPDMWPGEPQITFGNIIIAKIPNR